MRYSYIMRYS